MAEEAFPLSSPPALLLTHVSRPAQTRCSHLVFTLRTPQFMIIFILLRSVHDH
jgi:hypothetical protein